MGEIVGSDAGRVEWIRGDEGDVAAALWAGKDGSQREALQPAQVPVIFIVELSEWGKDDNERYFQRERLKSKERER